MHHDINVRMDNMTNHGVCVMAFSVKIKNVSNGSKKCSMLSPCLAENSKNALSNAERIDCNELVEICGKLFNQLILFYRLAVIFLKASSRASQ